MVFAIFDEKLNYKGILTDTICVDWVINYQQANTFTIEIANSDYSNSRHLLKSEYFIYEKTTKTMMIIEKVKYSDVEHKIYAYGYGVEHLLSWRIITVDNKSTNAEQRIRQYLINNQRGLIVDLGKLNNFTDTIEESEQKNSELLSSIYSVCKDADLDIIVSFNQSTKRFIMDINKVRDKTYKRDVGGRIFSVEFGNINNIELDYDNLQYKTKAYCEIKDSYLIVEKPSNDSYVREIYLNTPVTQKKGENDDIYRNRVRQQMQKDIKHEYKAKSELTADILNDNITADITVGDRITCKSKTCELMANATVSSINIRLEFGTEKKTFTFTDIEKYEE